MQRLLKYGMFLHDACQIRMADARNNSHKEMFMGGERLITEKMDQAARFVSNGAECEFQWQDDHCTFNLKAENVTSLLNQFNSEGNNVNAKAFIQTYRNLAERMKQSKPK